MEILTTATETIFHAGLNRNLGFQPVDAGLKWGINQIRGGYVSLFMCADMMVCDASYAVQSVKAHIRIFGQPPRDFGFDRAAWSQEHKEEIRELGVKNLGIAPKGQANGKWVPA